MSRIRYALAAAVLVSALWAQNDDHPTSNSAAAEQSAQPKPGAAPSATMSTPPDSDQLEAGESVLPTYPNAAREQNVRGLVVIEVLVSEAGDVENSSVIRGDPLLREAAMEAAKRWKFKPFLKGGQTVAAVANLSFDFGSATAEGDEHPDGSADTSPVRVTVDKGRAFPKSIRVSSGVTQAMILRKVPPKYPEAAKKAHVQGTVALHGTISTDGKVKDITVLSGPPELVDAAIEAVQQWLYKPYLLMGRPVEVHTEFILYFTLSG